MKTIFLIFTFVVVSICHAGAPNCVISYIEENLKDNVSMTASVFPEYIAERFGDASKVCFKFQKGDMFDVAGGDIVEPPNSQGSRGGYPIGQSPNYYGEMYNNYRLRGLDSNANKPYLGMLDSGPYGGIYMLPPGNGAKAEGRSKVEDKEKYLIVDRETKLSIWMLKEQLDFVGKQVKLKDSVFNGKAFAEKCIPYRPNSPFQVNEVKRSEKGYEVLLQSQVGLQIWVPFTELKIERTRTLDAKCPQQKAEKLPSKTAT